MVNNQKNKMDRHVRFFVDNLTMENTPTPSSVQSDLHNKDTFVILYPPERGFWSVFTCVLGCMAMFICDGICLSLFLFDDRVGMVNCIPFHMHTLEHIAVISLCRYLIGTSP